MSGLTEILLAEILRDSHHYAPGIEHSRPTSTGDIETPRRRRLIQLSRERGRDAVERAADALGFNRRHFDPELAAAKLQRVLAIRDGLEATYAALADDRSRRTLIDVLKLRVLGPYHAPLRLTPEAFRAKQADVERRLLVHQGTYAVSDPWFSPLSLYRIPVDGGEVSLHAHSVDITSVFLLGQYGYSGVSVQPGDVVIDVGGCWGDTALYFGARVGPAGRVYTFEFDPESLRILNANVALNPQLSARIEIVQAPLWDRSGERLGYAQAGRMTKVLGTGCSEPRARVESITLDDFVTQAGLEQVDFVKIDVEGAEANVLRGARRTLKRFSPRLAVAAYHHDDDLVRIPEALQSLGAGYRFYLDTFSPVEEETVLFATATSSST